MQPLAQQLDFSDAAAPLPEGFSDELYELCRGITCPDIARQVFEKLQPLLGRHRADKNLAIACGLLFEKQRADTDLGALWNDLQARFPNDAMTLRMLMRWYRRDGRIDDGVDHIRRSFPERYYSLSQAKNAIQGLSELKAWDEIDAIMDKIALFRTPDRAIRMGYIKALAEQLRFPEAARLAAQVTDRDRMGTASQELLATVERKADIMRSFRRTRTIDLIDDMIALAGPPREADTGRRVVFFTGQLGTGGAERQMTRLACAFQAAADPTGITPQVWVRHANPARGADFYLPALRDAGVPTRILSDEPEVAIEEIDWMPARLAELLGMLAPDMRRHVGQLVSMFRAERTEVAYLWQDGGIVQAAIAAVVAGVPKIVTSFRGLPPNLRPHLYRDELPVLYGALARLPNVTLTANSQKSATAYEDWLGLAPGTVQVIPNATPAVLPDGDAADHAFWEEVVSASDTCTKTVVGVFRFDDNKRPLEWIEAAARYLETRDDTRFVMLGGGYLVEKAAALIQALGLSQRVFLAGIRSHVGFYMHKADLLMHLARMEGLPNVLIEAQLAGTAVLATPAGGTDEVVEDGTSGVLLSTADTLPEDELDGALAGLLADPAALARMGAAAKARSGDRFSADTILRRTAALLAPDGQGRT